MPSNTTDDPCLVRGEGITRCTSPGATLWPYEVVFPSGSGRPMTGKIRALDRAQARRLLHNCHPNALSVRVLPRRR
jgi:hypothetical protein